ncbi:CotH kinase family protein [Pseudobacteroides cellulosolvens]|uniref:Spore coat protein CotH n=1 Tax=Pseudobacteroides cellulosolvens ATCC 35603 = DSM 2933 TaxID=398512 RepID=A0A0L6JKW6_9FIRM|nr:CotH kinase family protein [Pseudobacteroides cellulosolvens]KNY26405.1 Spore coat protein CotH [Pseudobacteroides cellulosolvens ATCC 35603 = DSM 2933]
MRKFLCILLSTVFVISSAIFPAGYAKALSRTSKDSILHINEIMASSTSTLRDGDLLDDDDGIKGGTYSDWIEIYNTSTKAIDLSGYRISDSDATWTFPKGIVPANGCLLIWASGKDKVTADGQLHTNFKLGASGETITLVNSDGLICDSVKYGGLSNNESYGAKIDGCSSYVIFSKATPGKSNSEGVLLIKPPVFSKKGGLYTDAFDLILSTSDYVDDTKDALSTCEAVYYTLDGSDPAPGDVGTIKYTESIPIKSRAGEPDVLSLISTSSKWKAPNGEVFKGWTIKAAAYSDKGVKSKIITNSYFVDSDIFKRYNLPVISIVTDKSNFFDSSKGIYFTKSSQATETSDSSPVPIHVEAYDKDGSLWFSQNAGAKLHGQSSSRNSQKTLRIYASDDYGDKDTFKYNIFPGLKDANGKEIDKFKRLLLRNSGNDWSSTMFRDGLMQSLVSHLNVSTQAYRPSVMFLNGEFWGIHNIRERFDKYYFASHYNLDKNKLAILSWKLSSKETIEIDEGTTEDKEAYFNDIIEYLKVNSIKDKSVYENIKTKIDVDNFIDYQLSQIYFANSDWPGNNVVVWKYKTNDGKYHPEAPTGQDGRWRWVLKDTEFGFGLIRDSSHDTLSYAAEPTVTSTATPSATPTINATQTAAPTVIPQGGVEKGVRSGRNFEWAVFLFKTLLQNSEFRIEFINRFADNINTSFDTVRVNQRIGEMKAEIEKSIPEHIDRWQGITDWNSNVEQMKTFAKDRPDKMRKFIVDKFTGNGVTGTSKISLNSDSSKGHIKINSIDITTSTPGITNPDSWTGTYFKGVPITLKAVPENGYEFSHWDGEGIADIDKTSDIITFDPAKDMNITAVFVSSLNDIGGHWAENYIKDLMKKEILKGYPDSTFKPENKIDRASAAAIIVKILGLEAGEYDKKFADNIPEWAREPIMAACKAGIFNGYDDNTFRAEKNLTRQELVVILVRALGYKDLQVKGTLFKDNDKIGKWSVAYVAKAFELELIKGYEDKSFRPDNMITRAEFAAIIAKVICQIKEVEKE